MVIMQKSKRGITHIIRYETISKVKQVVSISYLDPTPTTSIMALVQGDFKICLLGSIMVIMQKVKKKGYNSTITVLSEKTCVSTHFL